MPTPSGLVTKQELIDAQLDTAHLGRVVNSKDASGAPISTSTNRTGGVNKTLDALEAEYDTSIASKEAEADAAIDNYRLNSLGEYSSGITIEDKFQYITYDGESYFASNPPYTTGATLPDMDSNLFVGGYTTLETVAEVFSNVNLLPNPNFLTPSPDAITPPGITPTSYAAGVQIFSGVFTNETSGITNLTYIDGRVSFTGGDLYFAVPNARGVARLTEFVASVADFNGKPRTRGVSFALVGDEYRVTVGVGALEDESAVPTPLGSVKFEQGSIPTKHSVNYGVISVGSNTPRPLSERFSDIGNILDYERFKVGNNWQPAFTACINAHTITFAPDGLYEIHDPIILPPNKSLIGTQTATIDSQEWVCTIWKSTNNLDEAGNDSIIQMHNNQRPPAYPSDPTKYESGNQRLENIALMGNISTGYPNVSGGGLDAQQNKYGVSYSVGPSVFIRDVCCHNTETMLHMEQPWLSEVTSFQGYGTIETVAGTTTNFKACEALWCGRGSYIFGHTYSTIQSCGSDIPYKAAYTFNSADCLTLISCGNEGFTLDPIDTEYPVEQGIYLNFQGGENNVTVINHRAFFKWQDLGRPAPNHPVYMISASGNDQITFVGGEIDRPLPVVTPTDYFRESMILKDNAKVHWTNPPFYFRFPAMYITKPSTARYTYDGPNGIYTDVTPQLHDYRSDNLIRTIQQGSWEPKLFIGGSASGIGYSRQSGTWSRVDDLVTVNFSILVNAVGAQIGSCTIQGLPFPIDVNEEAYSSVRYQNFTGGVASTSGVLAVTGGGGVITLYKPDGQTLLSDADIPSSPTIVIGASFSYRAR